MLRHGESFCLKVKGDSMKEDGILSDDLLVVRKQATARHGQTIVAFINGEATVKRLVHKGRRLELHPANAAMQPLVVTAQDTLTIEGIVTGVIRHVS